KKEIEELQQENENPLPSIKEETLEAKVKELEKELEKEKAAPKNDGKEASLLTKQRTEIARMQIVLQHLQTLISGSPAVVHRSSPPQAVRAH
ncbi:hypothetical protein HON41_03005, partial [bacterium]|nr:hypothetical protein [bacterium]